MIVARYSRRFAAVPVNTTSISKYLKNASSGNFWSGLSYTNNSNPSVKFFSGLRKKDGDYEASPPSVGGKETGVDKNTKGNKRLSVEKIYQKKSPLEHILLRPDTYIGSVQPVTEKMWVYDEVGISVTFKFPSLNPS